ncbi:MAG TPA: DNA polymerase domain-containing protein, partial [Thermoplasmata archaeon]|nr:DNA polymerase domain-containing protein [Thermoplasmata archaeon]
VRHNLSLETLNCACCPESPHVAPGLGYRSCTLRDGIVPKTLRPILARRLEYKRRRRSTTGAERERYTDLARAWKWVLVTSFGYQGYRNARFGRIECHEAINAYARAELAQLAERAAATGWKVLHGIVDSLWMKAPPGADPEAFAREVTESRGLPLAYEGRYRWIVFLPNHGHGFGVPQRYYGYYEHGEFKVRGIEVRRGDACAFVQRVQQEALDALAPVEGAAGFLEAIPGVLELGRRRAEELLGGTVPVGDLVLARRASKALADYRVFSDGVAALRRLASEGVERAPGEEVAYVITDGATRDWRRKVVPRELLQGDEAYDGRAYAEILARSFETLFLPFGYTLERVLDRWGLGPRRTGYRKGERRSLEDGRQRTLSEGLAS